MSKQRRRGVRKLAHKFKTSKNPVVSTLRKAIPIAAGIAGHVIGGPPGAAIGAGIGKGLVGNGNFLDNVAKGAVVGGASSLGANFLGGATGMDSLVGGQGIGGVSFGGGPGGFASLGSGVGNTVGNGISGFFGGGAMGPMGQGMGGAGSGMGGMGAVPGRTGAMGSLLNVGKEAGPGIFSQVVNGLGGPVQAGLLTAGLIGGLGSRTRVSKEQKKLQQEGYNDIANIPIADMSALRSHKWPDEYQYRKPKPLRRRYIPSVSGQEELYPGHFDEVNPELEYYAKGGYVRGKSGGQIDNRPKKIPKGSFVMNATDVSLLGDGNSENGARQLQEMEQKFLKSGLTRAPSIQNLFNAKVSDGEYIIRPEAVTKIGKGSNSKGAQILEYGRRKMRQHKGVKKILPPKSKPMVSYMRG